MVKQKYTVFMNHFDKMKVSAEHIVGLMCWLVLSCLIVNGMFCMSKPWVETLLQEYFNISYNIHPSI